MKNNKKGFTLLELLVVILIIGILAAVALPQYQKAVYKARFIQASLMVYVIFDAEQEYALTNGTYATNFSKLNIDLPPTNGTPDSYAFWNWGYCFVYDEYGGCGLSLPNGGAARKLMWWNNSSRPQCYATENPPLARKICEAATGKKASQAQFSGGNYIYYF